jgi:hypothetical protein
VVDWDLQEIFSFNSLFYFFIASCRCSLQHSLCQSTILSNSIQQFIASMAHSSSSEEVRDSLFAIEKPVFPHAGDAEHMATDDMRATDQHIPVYNKLDFVSETDLTFSSIIKGAAANPLTNFEKKAALVNVYV